MGACATNIQREQLCNTTRCPSITEYESTHHETPLKYKPCSSDENDSDHTTTTYAQKPRFSFKSRDRTLLRQTFNDECSSIAACRSIQRILLLFRYYRFLRKSLDIVECHDELFQFLDAKYTQMINDFHHVVHRHLQRSESDSARVYRHLQRYMKCNDMACAHRMRNSDVFYHASQWPNAALRFYMSIVDTIHCCLWHGHDHVDDDDDDQNHQTHDGANKRSVMNNLYHDAHMERIRQSIMAADEARCCSQSSRFCANKFHTQFAVRDVIRCKLERVKEHEMVSSNTDTEQYYEYCSDPNLYYWEHFRHCACDFAECYVHRKYRNLKQEMLHNTTCRMQTEEFDQLWYKAEQLLRHSHFIQRMRYKENVDTMYYGIPRDAAFGVVNIFCILVYTHCVVLSAHFRDSFRRRNRCESMQHVKHRNAEFWWLSRILRETVDGFGTGLGEHRVDTLYTSISCRLFACFQCRFVGITSTTPRLSVVAAYALQSMPSATNGIVLQLDALNTCDQTLRYIDCAMFSAFANEEEKIFFGGHGALKISSIKTVHTCEDYRYFIHAIEIFTYFVNGKLSSSSSNRTTTSTFDNKHDDDSYSYQIIRDLIAAQQTSSRPIPCYIHRLFVAFCESKLDLTIDLYTLRRDCIELLPLFLHTHCDNLLRFDELCCVFPKCWCITVDDVGRVDRVFFEHLLSMITRINHRCNACRLRKIELRNIVLNTNDTADTFLIRWLRTMFTKRKWNAHIDKYSMMTGNRSQYNHSQEQMTDLILVKQKYNKQTTNFSLLGYANVTM